MDNSFQRQESNAQQKRGILGSLQVFDSILSFIRHSVILLVGLIWLTEEEQEDAGVYLGHPGEE